MFLWLHNDVQKAIPQKNPFDYLMELRGEIYRQLENRRTQRVEIHHQPYFIKQHFGVGWKEIFKNLFQGRLPVVSARNEWLAVQKLQNLNIPTLELAGYGTRGWNPAKRQSFLLSRELPAFITVEELGKQWRTARPAAGFKYSLIKEIARIARTLHSNGINHRDFYICHFLLDLIQYHSHHVIKLYLIDLHRAGIRKKIPVRWVIKDLAGLYFSSHDIGLSERDLWRFMRWYREDSLKNIIHKERDFWTKVKKRGDQLYGKQRS